jgi:phosphatidylglycerol:prolipoprotein diacylglycerol transferase
MHPRLIDISTGISGLDHLILPSYFTFVAVGFILATWLMRRWARQHKLDPALMTDFVIWMAFFGVFGARALHIVADGHFWDYINVCLNPSLVDWKVDAGECRALKGVWDSARAVCHPRETNCLAMIDISSGGFAFYGGFIAAGLFSVHFVKKHHLPVGKVVDMASWMLMLGLAWGRIGCFLASCCFGARTDSLVGVIFPPGSSASRYHWEQGWLSSYRLHSLSVHPTQLYESAAGLAIAAFAYFWLRPRKRFDGQVFCVVAGLYAVFRFLIEFIRRDQRGSLFGISTSQMVALIFFAVSGLLWVYFSGRGKRGPEPSN